MPTPPSAATGPSLGVPVRKSSLRRATPIASTSSGISSVSALPQPTASLSSTLKYREQREQRERERERERAEIEERGYGSKGEAKGMLMVGGWRGMAWHGRESMVDIAVSG